MGNKQTAVDYLYRIVQMGHHISKFDWVHAKEIEQENIEDAFNYGKWDWEEHLKDGKQSKDPVEYYNETYVSKNE